MRTDEDIENKKYPVKKQKKSKGPLVLSSAVDPPKAKAVEWASLLDEIKALMPEYPDQTPADRAATAAYQRRLSNPVAPKPANRFVRSLRENSPAAAQYGVSSSLVAAAHERAKQQMGNALADRRINQPPLMTKAAQNPVPEIAEPGYFNALSDVAAEPSRLLPWSPGFAEGAGAYAPAMAAMTLDPAGAALGGAAFKVAGAAGKAALPVVKAAAKRVADVPLPTNALAAARQLVTSESGQAMPGWMGAAAKAGLDKADDAFEGGYRAAGNALGKGVDFGTAAITTGAQKIAPRATTIGDALHYPKVKAEELVTNVANRIDLPGRTGKTADEWLEAAKHAPAATSSPVANKLLDDTRRFFISDFGMSPEQKAIREAGRVAGVNVARPAEELAVRLGKERTDAEQVDIYKYATGMDQPPGPMNPQAFLDGQAVRNVSKNIDRTLEDLGALPQGMTDLYEGTHLPRGYAKHWQAENQLENWSNDPIRKFKEGVTDNRILGSYRRGLDETMSENEFLARQASAAQTGENWRQVSRNQDGSINAHRDWTEVERQGWGEIMHAPSGLQRKANKARREAEAATILAEYARPGARDARGAFAEPIPAFTAGAPTSAVHPPTKMIPGPDGVPRKYILLDGKSARDLNVHRYGKLANHYVRDDVLFYLKNENEFKPFIDKINKFTLNNLWKKAVTIGNFPGYFVNNFFQNPLILERTGGSMMDVPAAWVDLAQNSIDVQRMEQLGVIRNGVLARELGSQLSHFNKTLSSQHMPDGFSVSKNIFRAMNALKKYEQDAYKLAGASDDLYRVAMVKGLVAREGKTFEEAAEIAKTAFYDSAAVTAPAAHVASVVSPFAKVLWWAANNEAKAWTLNPGKAAYINGLVSALPVVANFAMGKTLAQQDAENLSLPKNMQDHGDNAPLPFKDAEGNSKYLDTSSWNHYNQFKPVEGTALQIKLPVSLDKLTGGVIPIGDEIGYPRGLALGGPLLTVAQAIVGRDFHTGKNIRKTYEGSDFVGGQGTLPFLWKNSAPGVARNGAALYGTMTGDDDFDTKATDMLRRLTGIKVKVADRAKAAEWNKEKRSRDKGEMKLDGATQWQINAMENESKRKYGRITGQQ